MNKLSINELRVSDKYLLDDSKVGVIKDTAKLFPSRFWIMLNPQIPF